MADMLPYSRYEASIAIIYGLEIVSYIKSIVLRRFWACTDEASVPNTGRLFFFFISRWPVIQGQGSRQLHGQNQYIRILYSGSGLTLFIVLVYHIYKLWKR